MEDKTQNTQKVVDELRALGYTDEAIVSIVKEAREEEANKLRWAKYNELIKIAHNRGWTVNMHSGDCSWFNCIKINEDGSFDLNNHFSLSVWVESEEFEFSAGCVLTIQLTTGKVGSFRNEDHFLKFEDKMHQMANNLWRRGFMPTSPQNRID
jgi:hypothetical protein